MKLTDIYLGRGGYVFASVCQLACLSSGLLKEVTDKFPSGSTRIQEFLLTSI